MQCWKVPCRSIEDSSRIQDQCTWYGCNLLMKILSQFGVLKLHKVELDCENFDLLQLPTVRTWTSAPLLPRTARGHFPLFHWTIATWHSLLGQVPKGLRCCYLRKFFGLGKVKLLRLGNGQCLPFDLLAFLIHLAWQPNIGLLAGLILG